MRGGEERSTGIRKKGSGVRQWLVLDGRGETEVVEAGKHAIMRRTGLPARDLRILDPLLSYPSTLLGRERAIVINLEHIKAIITAHEACLEAACSVLENEAKTLEQEAHPALDKLTSKISTLNLERVRQIKSRLVAITGRVQKVRDELEHLLDDDDDMAEMYLSEKLAEQDDLEKAEDTSSADDVDDHIDRTAPEISLDNVVGRDSHGTRDSATYSAVTKQLDVEELEMLLEAYFVQIDGTLNKLSTLREYVDDTEDYINIMLDDKQNHLLQMGVMLTTATLVVSAFVVVAGIFGMNIHIELFDDQKAGMTQFLWTVGGSTAGTIFLYVVAIAWCKHKRLLE
uniref:Magnesium transporter n=1 Tax=Glycine max TaxID=3847 RepID=I1JAX9_SOYBN